MSAHEADHLRLLRRTCRNAPAIESLREVEHDGDIAGLEEEAAHAKVARRATSAFEVDSQAEDELLRPFRSGAFKDILRLRSVARKRSCCYMDRRSRHRRA